MRTLLISLLCVGYVLSARDVSKDVINQNIDRTIDLTSHAVKVSEVITIENKGNSDVRTYTYAVQPSFSDGLSFIGAVVPGGEEDEDLGMSELSGSGRKYSIDLPQLLSAGQTLTFTVNMVITHMQKPYPVRVTQEEKQMVLFSSNLYCYSPYHTTSQTTKVNLASANVQSYTQTKPSNKADKTITYGPYADKQPYSEDELKIHVENNSPFLTVTSMTRTIEVSHWGNIAVEEEIFLSHTGAQLEGPFSRVDYQRRKEGNSVNGIKMVLPPTARDVYYRDEIGNISTSHMRQSRDAVEVELRPRFPLFGGWKTHYLIGYNIPSWQYLYHKGENFILKMPFVDHVFDDQVIDELTVKIIFPEGARNIKLKAPYEVKHSRGGLHYTYLDISGRPVVSASKNRLVEESIQDFEVSYRFSQMMLIREPLYVVAALYLFFFIVIVYVRLDFTITKDEAKEVRMKVSSLIDSVRSQFEQLTALHQAYFDSVDKFKTTKDSATFAATRKRIESQHKSVSQKITELQTKVRSVTTDLADKVGEAVRLEESAMNHVRQAMQAADRYIAGKLDKSSYVEQESQCSSKRDDVIKRADAILAAL